MTDYLFGDVTKLAEFHRTKDHLRRARRMKRLRRVRLRTSAKCRPYLIHGNRGKVRNGRRARRAASDHCCYNRKEGQPRSLRFTNSGLYPARPKRQGRGGDAPRNISRAPRMAFSGVQDVAFQQLMPGT